MTWFEVGQSRRNGLFALATVGVLHAGAGSAQPLPCDEFRGALEVVPHVTLTQRAGALEWTWDQQPFEGCQVDFSTTDSVRAGAAAPDFAADPGTDMYRGGWRMIPELMADGAGSGVHGLRRGSTECVVRWDQPAYIEDDGSFVQSDTLTMLIQCRAQRSR